MNESPPRGASAPRAFAVVPAAGRSRRMGRAKLLLPWGEGKLIDGVLSAWRQADVDAVVLVAHPDDVELADHCRRSGINVVVPSEPPAEMKDSVRLALAHLEHVHAPAAADLWLLAPADIPALSPAVIRQVVAAARRRPGAAIVPVYEGRRGHPAAFPWSWVEDVSRLGDDEGINALLHRDRVIEIECGPAAIPPDVDTPEDYRRINPP